MATPDSWTPPPTKFIGWKLHVKGHIDLPIDPVRGDKCGEEDCSHSWIVRIVGEHEHPDGEITNKLLGHFCQSCLFMWLGSIGAAERRHQDSF
jgi:hypothetical protein